MAADAQNGPETGSNRAPSRPFSVWAILAMLLSVTVFCPVFSLLGMLFGLRALTEIKAQPNMRGRGLARAAMVISIIALLGWVVGSYFWNKHARQPMLNGPIAELKAGMAGDIASFKSCFTANGANADDQEARRFLDELTRRYGPISGAEQDSLRKGSMPAGGQGRIPYIFHAANGDVRGEALYITFGGSAFRPVFAWDWLLIADPDRGDLFYPLAARARATPQTAATQP